MTDSIFFSPRLFPASSSHSERRTSLLSPTRRPASPRSTLPRVPAEDHLSQGLMLGLVAATVPAIVYGLLQSWHLASSDALLHAVRTFVP